MMGARARGTDERTRGKEADTDMISYTYDPKYGQHRLARRFGKAIVAYTKELYDDEEGCTVTVDIGHDGKVVSVDITMDDEEGDEIARSNGPESVKTRCSKCGEGDISTRHLEACDIRMDYNCKAREEQEHLERHCRNCSYEWCEAIV